MDKNKRHTTRKRGVVLSTSGWARVEAAQHHYEHRINDGRPLTLKQLSQYTHLSVNTLTKIRHRHVPVDRQTLENYFQAFNISLSASDYASSSHDQAKTQANNSASYANASQVNASQANVNSGDQLNQSGFTGDRPLTPDIAESRKHVPSTVITDAFPTCRIDWGEAPDVTTFYGRDDELSTLNHWLCHDHTRLIAILGMGGIGKTALTAKAVHTLDTCNREHPSNGFDAIVWRSLRNAPSLGELLEDLVPFVSDQQDTDATSKRLLHWLRQSRCLLILDNMETILQGGDRTGYFRAGYQDYGELLQLLAETRHQSSVVLTSREKPAFVGVLEGVDFSVRSLQLSGSPEAAHSLMESKGLIGTETEKQELGDRYGNSPLALKIVATSIQSLFDGEISLFLAEDTLIFNGLQRLLDQQFERLSTLGQAIMYWLAINREWTSISDLVEDIQPTVTRQRVLEMLESLSWQSLLETQSGQYTQQPVVMEYVTNRFVECICNEILELGNSLPTSSPPAMPLFYSHALLKTTVKDYIRESQIRLIVDAIVARLYSIVSASGAIAQHIQALFKRLRADLASKTPDTLSPPSYGAGNFLNLCHHLNINLEGYDFSSLTIWHADLQPLELHRVNIAYASIAKTSFSQLFSAISAVTFSPDGRLLVFGDSQGQIHLWRMADLQPCLILDGHLGWVHSLWFTPDGTLLVSAGDDGIAKVWKIRQNTSITVPSATDSSNPALSGYSTHQPQFSCHLLRVLEGHSERIWSTALRPTLEGYGWHLATGSGDRTVKLWDLTTGQLLATTEGHTNQITSVRFSPNGDMLASGSLDQTVKLWSICTTPDGITLHLIQTLIGHSDGVWSVQFHPYAPILVSSGNDRTIRLWDIPTGKLLTTFTGHTEQITTLDICPDGFHLLSGSSDYSIKLWDLSPWIHPNHYPDKRSSMILATFKGHTKQIWTTGLSPDGTLLASGSNDQTIRLWDISSRQLLHTIRGQTNQILSVDVCFDGTYFVTGSSDQTIRLWNRHSSSLVHTLRGHKNWVLSVATHPTNFLLASGSADCTIRLWDMQTGSLIRVLSGHASWIWSVAFSPDATLLASGSFDQTIRRWDVQTGALLHTIEVANALVWSVAFNPVPLKTPAGYRHILASGDSNHRVQVWDVATGTLLETLEGHANPVWSVAWSPDGTLLASGSSDCTVNLWNASPVPQSSCLLHTFQGHEGWVRSVAFSSDGTLLASGSYDHTVSLWDIHQRTRLSTLHGHENWVMAIAFCPEVSDYASPTSTLPTLISGSIDATLKLWNLTTETCEQTLRIERPYEGMNITGVQGLTEGQLAVLQELGAVDHGQTRLGGIAELSPDLNASLEASAQQEIEEYLQEVQAPNSQLGMTSKRIDKSKTTAEYDPETKSNIVHVESSIGPDSVEATVTQRSSPILHIQVLNRFNLTYQGELLQGLSNERSQSLLAYLILHQRVPQSRQRIAALFYPDASDSQARTALRKDLFNLRQALPESGQFLETDARTIQWNEDADFSLDVANFESALNRAEQLSESDADRTAKQHHLQEAIAHYQGRLLPSFDQEWVMQERERLHQRYLNALDELISLLEQTQHVRLAIRYAQQLLQEDPLRELTYQTLMRLYGDHGDRATAIQIYHQCMTILRDELGINPSSETQHLYQTLLD